MHDSKGGTDSGIIIYKVQSVFSHKFAQVCKNPDVINCILPFLPSENALYLKVKV